MRTIITFFGSLNDFLIKKYRNQTFDYPFSGTPTIKHLIEALHVPHPEVGVVYANQQSTTLNDLVGDGDNLEVHPIEYPANFFTQAPGFVLDSHLGKLALYLRMMGFDTNYRNDFQDKELARLAILEQRILLTRDRQLLMLKSVQQGYWVRSLDPEKQIVEIIDHFKVSHFIQQFSRCLRCNEVLVPVDKNAIRDRLEPKTKLYFNEFKYCTGCNQIYWKGSHYEHMLQFLKRVFKQVTSD